MSAIGDAIAKDREDRDLTQAVLALNLSVSQQVLSRWEAGLNMPRGQRIEQLISFFGPESRTADLVRRMRELEPSVFESANALPTSMAGRSRYQGEPIEDAIERLKRERHEAELIRLHNQKYIQPSQSPEERIQLQFARASEQLSRAVTQLSDCAHRLARVAESMEAMSTVVLKTQNVRAITNEPVTTNTSPEKT
jgi:transcriptional regulator with XRE-family HTH domain